MGGEEKARINENTDGAEGGEECPTCLRILADQREQKGMKFTSDKRQVKRQETSDKTSEYLSKGCNADFELRGERNACFYISTRLRAVSYFSLQSYCTRNPSTRAAIKEGVSPRKNDKRLLTLVLFGDNEAVNVI